MARPRSPDPSPAALRMRESRRRRKLGILLRVVLPKDIIFEIELRGIDPDDPVRLGELIIDALDS